MATTAKVIPFEASTQGLPAVEPITQLRLLLVLSLRRRVQQVQEQLDKEEATLQAMVEAGAVIEPGKHSAAVKESFRRNVSWKSVCIRLAKRFNLGGAAYCARVLAATKPDRTVSLEIN